MKITTFNPLIISKDAENIIKLFEELGFEQRHKKTDIEGGEVVDVRMKNEGGFHVDVAGSAKRERDLTAIRINVDNFETAYDLFISHGFINPQGDKVSETSSSVDTLLVSPSGFTVMLCEHVRE